MGRRYHVNPFEFGLMGAILGGLQFKLNESTQQRAQEAEIQKEQRLAQIEQAQKIADESRANAEYTRREDIQQQHALEQAEYQNNLISGREQTSQQFQAQQNALNRSHDLTLEQIRAQDQQAAQENAGAIDRKNTMFRVGVEQVMGGKPGEKQGMYGTDGKFYPTGAQMPAGVTPTVGFGATNLGLRGTQGGGYVSPRQRVGAVNPMPVQPQAGIARPTTQQDYAALPSGTRYIAPDGTIRIKP